MKKDSTEKKIKKHVRRVTNSKDLKGAMKALPDNNKFAWYEMVGGEGTTHNGTGLKLEKGTFVFIRLDKVKDATKLFKRVEPGKEMKKEEDNG